METLKFTEQKTFSKRIKNRTERWVALFLAIGTFLSLKELFQVKGIVSEEGIDGIGSGLIRTWNQIATTLGRNHYLLLPKWEEIGKGNISFLILAFVLLVLFFHVFLERKHAWGMVGIVGVIAMLSGIFGLELSIPTAVLFGIAMASGALYLCRQEVCFVQNMVMLVFIAMLTLSLFSFPTIKKAASGTKQIRKVREVVQRQVKKSYYGENILKNGNLTERTREQGEGAALEVTMSRPQSLYLRGFVGERYLGNRWEALPNRAYYEEQDLFYWLKQDGFQALGQLGQAAKLAAEQDGQQKEAQATHDIDVQVKNADRRYAYLPYEVKGEVAEGKTWGGSVVTPANLHRLDSYTYQAEENAVKHWTDIAAKMFLLSDSAATDSRQKEEALATYISDESYYNAYVYENFTYLSKKERLLLKNYIGDTKRSVEGHADYKIAIQSIQEYLEKNFIYTEQLGAASGKSSDVLEEFLLSKKGYDIHFASAAVLMFRYYGIPARYVEGYLITPPDAEQMEEGKPQIIKRERAHAWAEIYIDGIGFVPIEVSPPYRFVMEEADMEVGLSNDILQSSFAHEQVKTGKKEQLQTSTDTDTPIVFPIQKGFFFLFLCFLFWLLWNYLRKIFRIVFRVLRRNYVFQKENPKLAVCAIFAYMEEQAYPIKEQVRALGNKAAYSAFPITEEERRYMLKQYRFAAKEKKKNEKK